jgi:hypothetical protein
MAEAASTGNLASAPLAPATAPGEDALWMALREAADIAAAAGPWLQIQARMIAPEATGAVMLRDADGQLKPAATLPADRPADPALLRLADMAIRQGRGVVGLTRGGDGAVAYPLVMRDGVAGAAVISYAGEPTRAMRLLQWGIAQLRDLAARRAVHSGEAERAHNAAVLELLSVTLDEERFAASALAAATHLALAFGCDRVAIGTIRRGHSKVAAISHSATFGKQMLLVAKLSAAMDEAIDQRATILYPAPDADAPLATRAHAELVAEASPRLCTIPMLVRDKFFGAVVFERPADRPFTPEDVEILSAAVSALGPLLEERRLNDRWIGFKLGDSFTGVLRRLFGPGHAGLKTTAASILAIAAFLSFATGTYEVSAKAGLEGLVRRAVVAPLDGYIKLANARAGDRVGEGEVIAALEDSDLTLERLRWTTERQQRQIEYDRAFAARDRSALATSRSQIDEADAQIKLVDEQLSRLQLKAPFDALVTAGDLSQSIGAVVSRGTTLFELAPLDAYRVTLAVDQSQIGDVELGQTGSALFAAVPDEPFEFVVDKITPVAEAREGHTVFRVEGKLTGAPERLRPGMDGVAKIEVEQRLLVWIWARSFLDWARIASWQWLR